MHMMKNMRPSKKTGNSIHEIILVIKILESKPAYSILNPFWTILVNAKIVSSVPKHRKLIEYKALICL
jgi:hypothetical protein